MRHPETTNRSDPSCDFANKTFIGKPTRHESVASTLPFFNLRIAIPSMRRSINDAPPNSLSLFPPTRAAVGVMLTLVLTAIDWQMVRPAFAQAMALPSESVSRPSTSPSQPPKQLPAQPVAPSGASSGSAFTPPPGGGFVPRADTPPSL